METSVSIIIVVIIFNAWDSSSSQARISKGRTLYSGEYCLMETFRATCPPDHRPNLPLGSQKSTPMTSLVVIERAKYGRMKEGRCMRKNYDEKGCNTDVLDILDRKCSGQQACNVTLPDPDLFETKPCPEDLNPYLEAAYYCLSVNYLDKDTCLRDGHVLLTSSEGYLTGQLESSTHPHHHHLKVNQDFGRTARCYYVIEVLPGQKVNLSIINFARDAAMRHPPQDSKNKLQNYYHHQSSSSSSGHNHHHHHHHHHNRLQQLERSQPQMVEVCTHVITVHEEGGATHSPTSSSSSSLSLCTGEEREKLVHVSKGHRVKVEFLATSGNNFKQANFLLRYKASGCPSVFGSGSEDTWQQREGGVMKVGCNATNEIWYLTCREEKWGGTFGNCSASAGDATDSGWKLKQMLNMEDSLPFGMFLVVAMGVAIGVIIGSLLLCTIAMVTKRHRRLLVKPGHRHHHQQPQQRQLPQLQHQQQQQQRSRLDISDEHRDSICFYQDQSSIALQPAQQYYQRCHHNQHQSEMSDCRCCSQRETAALLAEGVHRHGTEEIGGKNPSTPMVVRDAVKATHCQSKETTLDDSDFFGSQKSTHSAFQYHQLMLISGHQKGDVAPMNPKHPPAGDVHLIQPPITCSEHLCSLANSSFNYQ